MVLIHDQYTNYKYVTAYDFQNSELYVEPKKFNENIKQFSV